MELINSDFGLMYKSINSLELVHLMLVQKFKPVTDQLIHINVEHVKDELSRVLMSWNI